MMRKMPFSVIGAVVFATVAALAQTPSTPGSAQPPSTSRGNTISVTGCLKSAPTNPAGGVATDPVSGGAQFILTDVAEDRTDTASRPGTSGHQEKTYALRTEKATPNLGPHVDHKVTVTGTLMPAPDAIPGTESSTRPGTPGTEGRPGSQPPMPPGSTTRPPTDSTAKMPTLTVTAVKMVATTCS